MDANHDELSNTEIFDRLTALESRVAKLETIRQGLPTQTLDIDEPEFLDQFKNISVGSVLESKVGEYGLSWLGNIVLFFGIILIVEYIQSSGYQIASSVFGYISVAGIFILARFLKSIYPKIATTFSWNAYLLLFYVTLSLHFFTSTPLIGNKSLGLLLIALVAFTQLVISIRKKSPILVGIALVLLSIVAIVSDSPHFMLSIAIVIAATAVYCTFMSGWSRLLTFSIFLVYLINLFYFLNNPIMGHQIQAIKIHSYGFIYLFVIAAIYSLISLVKKSESLTNNGIVGSIVLNGMGFSMLLSLYVISFFKSDYVNMMGSISAFCLLYSVVLKIKSDWKITSSLYALFGFVTMSVMIHGIYDFPLAYFMLAIQSLLVVSMAIWFRSKFIVVMNTMLFIFLLIFYLSTSSLIDGVNISFSMVALVTARILNWKKDKLTIKTDILRNIYLIIGFIMVLITLFYLIPARYVTLSWTVAALLYFILSLVLKNIKYRYLALGTMIAAALYLFIVDLARIELAYRIIALMFLALISIGLSIYYSKKSKHKADKE
ncbi:MAG: hypothetical protein H8E34_07645 [Bacteroidetes bacterium]|nr:hypothetical protein [Bacteroidota bacterium]MBL6943528.1 hypothetical protein [Bacteroidales bacterium]